MKLLLSIILLICSGCASSIPEGDMSLKGVYNSYQHEAYDQHRYIPDAINYGVGDYWVASLTGDCEDYALWMKAKLGAGNLMYVRTREGVSHMVLKVGDYVFDNMHRNVYLFKDMDHKFIAVLSDDNPAFERLSSRLEIKVSAIKR